MQFNEKKKKGWGWGEEIKKWFLIIEILFSPLKCFSSWSDTLKKNCEILSHVSWLQVRWKRRKIQFIYSHWKEKGETMREYLC